MRFQAIGPDVEDEVRVLEKMGLVRDSDDPEVVFAIGGDGSILLSEMLYPSVPKAAFRKSQRGFRCSYAIDDLERVTEKIIKGKYSLHEERKIEAHVLGETKKALNEIQIRCRRFVRALRFDVLLDGKAIFKDVVADGVVIATPFGSTGYYRSVGGRPFKRGIGISINNPYTGHSSRAVPEDSMIEIRIGREDALLFADNDEKPLIVRSGDKISIRRSSGKARFITLQ